MALEWEDMRCSCCKKAKLKKSGKGFLCKCCDCTYLWPEKKATA